MQAPSAGIARHSSAGFGVVLTSQGGQIYGFDIDQSGSDGVLATAANVALITRYVVPKGKIYAKRFYGVIFY